MRNIAIVDETFDINITSTYHLSVQISSGGICFAILDTVRNKFIAFKHLLFEESHPLSVEDQIKRLLQTDSYLIHKYKSTGLIYTTPNAALIPTPIYDSGKEEDLYLFSNLLPDKHVIQSDEIVGIDAWITYAIPEKIRDTLEDHPNHFSIIHQSCPIIESAFRTSKNKADETLIFAQIYPGFFDVVVFKKGKFELYNSFSYKTEQDLIFYILYVFEQFDISAEETTLDLSGYLEKESTLIIKLREFLPNISFAEFNANFNYSYTFGQLNQYQFSNLFNLFSCV